MTRLISLIKKKMTGEATAEDEKELNQLAGSEEERKKLYQAIFSKAEETGDDDLTETEKAFAVHYVKLREGMKKEKGGS